MKLGKKVKVKMKLGKVLHQHTCNHFLIYLLNHHRLQKLLLRRLLLSLKLLI